MSPRYDNERDGMSMLMEAVAVGSHDGLIEASEARGQQELVVSGDLPIEMSPDREAIATGTGIVFGEPVNELFVACTFPPGWRKRPTEHSMHTELLDDKGRVRAGIFYKAAFYDRRASVSFAPFYRIETNYGKADESGNYPKTIRVLGGGQVVKEFGTATGKESDALWEAAKTWLAATYPQHADHFAYWNEAAA